MNFGFGARPPGVVLEGEAPGRILRPRMPGARRRVQLPHLSRGTAGHDPSDSVCCIAGLCSWLFW